MTPENQLTPSDRKQLFLLSLSNCRGHVTNACEMSDVTRKEYYEWMMEDEDFLQNVEWVAEELLDHVEGKLIETIDEGNLGAITYFLDHKGRRRGYGKQADKGESRKPLTFQMNFGIQNVNEKGESGTTITVESPEEIEE
jgi:hypothetical protein